MMRLTSAAFILSTSLAAGAGLERLSPASASAEPAVPLPRLTQPFVADGNLDEWSGVPAYPARDAASIAKRQPVHAWNGPADAGVSLQIAWTSDGLCLAARVTDDDVRNTAEKDVWWQQDCLELFVDGRTAPAYGRAPYSAGCVQLTIRPPQTNLPAVVRCVQANAALGAPPLGAHRTPDGYTVELLLPWAAFAARPVPGTPVGLMVALDDYDARDGNTTQPLQLAWDATSDAYCNPAHFVPFVLTEQAPDGPDVELGPRAAFAVPALAATNQSLALSVACDAPLSQQARTAAFRVADPDGRTLFERQVPLAPDAGGAGDSARATTDWLLRGVADGAYRASVRLLKADGTGLGVRTRPVRLMQQTYRQMSDAFRAIDVARLSQTNAFQAAAWLAAGAAADRFRSALAAGDESRMSANQREAAARIERLAGGTVAPDDTLIDLLNLTGQPEAQVTVEFNDASLQNAGVTFYCGSLPLVTARMRQFASPEEAARAVVNERHPGLVDPRVMRTVGEARAWTSTQAYAFVSFPLRAYAPDRQGLLFFAGRGRVNVLELSRLAVAKPAVAAFAEGCAEPVRQAVAAWAGRAGVTVVPLAQALTNASALVCGPTNDVLIAARLAKSPASLVTTRPGFTSLSVLAGRRLCAVHGPSRAAALQATRLAMAGEPISFAQADAVRDALVKDLAPVPLPAFALPSGMSLFCGDTHMHSFYSDGTGSPVALSLMALADQMDFSVLSDHNTLDGALLRDRLFTRFGFAATFIVGEEITTPFAHFNAYPLRTRVAWTNDANRIFRDAHSQGAVIQWNHPGYPGSAWDTDLQETGFDVSGLNAWEHYTPRIDGWEAAGRMPALVGSTDTHSGTFGVAERTVIVSMGAAGEDLAAAIRRRQTVLLSSEGPRFLYGPRRLTDLVWAALAEGQTLRTLRTERIQATLRRADLAGLLSAAPDRPVPEP